MKKKPVVFIFLLLLYAGNIRAQFYPAFTISSELTENAHAVVRDYSVEFVQQDSHNAYYKVNQVVTILSAKGDAFADFHFYEDNFEELKSFSGEIYNEFGKSVKKIPKKDLVNTEFSQYLASSGRHVFYDLYFPTYPFTVRYTFEIKYKNGILMYPAFNPVDGFHESVEKASYTLQLPASVQLREKKIATDVETKTGTIKQDKTYQWSISNFKALPKEPYAPVAELFPIVYISPEEFCVENVCGSMANWALFGDWSEKLLQGRAQLSQKTIDKALELTANAASKREKAKILYEYLQSATHYVNISLGIGGWQPMKAEEVAKTGFGDCKGLSNYMKALLQVVDIPSYYTIIKASQNQKRFFADYPSFSQANHVILMVPLENDTVWLECTSQSLPFGYIHSSIVGHDALAVGDKGAFFCTLPDYPPLDNQEINTLDIRLSSDGNALIQAHSTYKMDVFERMFFKLKGLNKKEENDVLGSLLKVHKPQISNFKKEEYLDSHPQMEIDYTVNCEDYASKTGSRMFIPVNPAHTSLRDLFPGNTRRYEILMESSLYEADTIRLHLPENYQIETKPQPTAISSPYGSFRTEIKEEVGVLVYIQILELIPGRFPALEFEDLKAFYNKVENLQTAKISLKKQ
jgi:hypothetical protein